VNETALTVRSADGHPLTVYCHEPQSPAVAGIVIAPAMAVRQSFYASFSSYLAAHGLRVWTFDYRGIGESKQGSMRTCDADISTWIGSDYDAVVQHASTAMAGLPLFVLGHSLGGQVMPLLPAMPKISGVINVSVGSGAARHLQPRTRRAAPLLWHVLTPGLCALFGYFPGKRIGVVGDVPRNALYQWRRWCLSAEYLFGIEPDARAAYGRVRCPILSLVFADDELLMESGASWLHDAYTGTRVDYRIINPADYELPGIGHFGFFKNNKEPTLWPLISTWLEQQLMQAKSD